MSAMQPDDPRVYFAAERTLLAWVRTGLTVIGLGFVVARFGLFLRMLRGAPTDGSFATSTWIGVGLVLIGSAAIGTAAWQHYRVTRQLSSAARPQSYLPHWSIWFAATICAVGIILALHIVTRSLPS